MEWYWVLLIIFGALVLLMSTGMPVAFCFLFVNVIGVSVLWGGSQALQQLTLSMWNTVASFVYLPITMFILLGEVVFRSSIAIRAINVIDKWLGRLPGRLGLLTVIMSTIFSTMSGSPVATTAVLGETLLPEMLKRGYKPVIAIGAITGSGGLAMMIPPSSPAVLWASIAEVSVGKILIAGVFPGLIMAVFYAAYVIIRCWLQPSVAPAYDVTPAPLADKLKDTAKYVLPLSFVVFMVTGLIFMGIAGPSEAAVMGVFAALVLAVFYREFNWKLVKDSLSSAFTITVMLLLILCGSQAFGQVLAFTGAAREMGQWVIGLPVAPIFIIIGMMMVLIILGCFMSGVAMMMIAIPVFMPIVKQLGLDPIWFGLLFLLNIEIGQETPPFGVVLFTMKGVAPPGTTMMEIIKADLPYLGCDFVVMALVLAFPALATWLPQRML